MLDWKTSSEYVEVAIKGIFTLEITSLGFDFLVIVVDVEANRLRFIVAGIKSSKVVV